MKVEAGRGLGLWDESGRSGDPGVDLLAGLRGAGAFLTVVGLLFAARCLVDVLSVWPGGELP